jgi:hypothetical protein
MKKENVRDLLVKLAGLSRQTLYVEPNYLPLTLDYHKRLRRSAVETEVESEARKTAVPCIHGKKYVGLGTKVIEERRLARVKVARERRKRS